MFKGSTPSDTDTGAGITGQLLLNDIINKLVDDTAVLASGVTKGKVVKYNATNKNWGLCDGTVKLTSTDVVGIVEYANGTSGQVRIAGVYTDSGLTANAAYYCQSNGSLGTTVTKVFIGRVTSPGRLCMPAGGGASLAAATTDSLGGVIIGTGISVTTEGKISAGLHGKQLFTASGTFTVPDGIDKVYVTAAGGGGGGGRSNGTPSGGGGGGGAACLAKLITVTPRETIAVTIGYGGAGGTSGTSSGAGGTTSFGSYLSLPGGGGGAGSGGGGGAAGGSGGTAGGTGEYGGGHGGGTIFASGAFANGGNGCLYGGGGSGGYSGSVGGAGAQGFMLIEW